MESRIESDNSALMRPSGHRQGFRLPGPMKATLQRIETIHAIRKGHVPNTQPGVQGETASMRRLFDLAA